MARYELNAVSISLNQEWADALYVSRVIYICYLGL